MNTMIISKRIKLAKIFLGIAWSCLRGKFRPISNIKEPRREVTRYVNISPRQPRTSRIEFTLDTVDRMMLTEETFN
jgi:hypothetical protein